MRPITLYPNTPDELKLIKQFAKVLGIKYTVIKELPKARKKRDILDSIEQGTKDVKAALRGEIKLRSARDVLNEL